MFDPALKAVIIYENHPIILKMKSMFPACETFNVKFVSSESVYKCISHWMAVRKQVAPYLKKP